MSGARTAFYGRLGAHNLAPLWEVIADLVTPAPRSACVPALWRYDELRTLLMEAGGAITAEEAERRVLVLENPGMRGASRITQSVFAGVQLIQPGESAPSHRHAASALRFVLESEGAFTAVEGERVAMRAGDLILTPSWTAHDHGNPGRVPAIWMDGLDLPIVNLFDASFAEKLPARPAGEPEGGLSRFCYPYASARTALETMRKTASPDPRRGFRIRYGEGPSDSPWPMPTLAAFLQLLPGGFQGREHRSTDAAVMCCVEGQGKSRVGGEVFEWARHDIFVAPSWTPVVHEASGDSVLFSFSDRGAQEALGLWRG
jgi:gentisate 1,2-dioxygenase